jgi:Histidine kinase-like ATPase domain
MRIPDMGVPTGHGRSCDRIEPHSGSGAASGYMQQQKWPLRSYIELGALPSAVPCARLHAKSVLWEWGLESFMESVELIVSEITTNAVAAVAGLTGSRYQGLWRPGVPPVRVGIYSDKERVLIEVWDGDDHLPEAQEHDPLAENGRGLLLVETLSEKWGAYRPEGTSGKVVWASLTMGSDEA